MALRWLLTETLTGRVVDEVTGTGLSITEDFDATRGSASLVVSHFIREDGSVDLPRASQLWRRLDPAGAYCLAVIDVEDAYDGVYDRVIGEWMIRDAARVTHAGAVPLSLGGLLDYAGDRLLERDYRETGHASWIVSDLLQQALTDLTVTIPKPTMGPQVPVDWRAGRITYRSAIRDVVDATGLEIAMRQTLELSNGTPHRVVREVRMGWPLRLLITGRVIDLSGNGISASEPVSLDLWASSLNVYGSGSGDDQVAGNAWRARPAGMPTVTRSISVPDIQSKALADATAAQQLALMTGRGPLVVETLRENWTNKFPSLGNQHRVVIDPCIAFPEGIDAQYRITRIEYQPTDTAPDTLRLTMEAQ